MKAQPVSTQIMLATYNKAILYLQGLLLKGRDTRLDIKYYETEKHNLLCDLATPRLTDEEYANLETF